jgi:polysaccharide biosynthesis protein PslG
MRLQRSSLRRTWPWLLIALVLVLGPVLAACGSAAPAGTPTPTKTPRSAEEAVTQEPAAAAAATDTAAPAATDAPSATPAASDTPAPEPTAADTATAEPTPTAKPPVVRGSDSMASPDYGVQAFLWWRPEVADRDLGLIRDGGFTWVKQLFSWQDIEGAGKGKFDWSYTDRIVDQAEKAGLKLIVRLSQDPDRPFWAGAPPQNSGHFADFAAAVAERYKGRIHAYQVWNEPNLAREWGGKRPDPKAYARMLQIAYRAIKAADPGALVITAGMAPTGTDSEIAMPDTTFYEQMYQAMGGKSDSYFDMLGVHAAGFAAAPEVSPDETAANKVPYGGERFFAFRHVEDIRAIMEKYGDADKRVAILEFGWTTDDRPDSPYYWHGAGAGIDEQKKGTYLRDAFQYAEDHWKPWIGLMVAIYMPDVDWTKDTEQYYWSIIGPGYPDLYLRAAYVILCDYLNKKQGKVCPYMPPS